MTTWRTEAEDLVRGMTGGLLVGVPLVFTMETWGLGGTLPPGGVLRLLVVIYALNLACIVWAGFRRQGSGGWRTLTDAVEATALALVTAGGLLAVLSIIRPGDPLQATVGHIVVAAIPISLGIAIANFLVGRDASRTDATANGNGDRPTGGRMTLLELGATAAGALFFTTNIAPTDEIPLLAVYVPRLMLPVVIVFSLLVTYLIVFEADFSGQQARRGATGVFQHPVTETLVAYALAVMVGVGVLWLFGRIGPGTGLDELYRLAVITGLPAAIGGAAGRLAV